MQIRDLEISHELGSDEQVAVLGGAVTGTDIASVQFNPGLQAGNAGLAFASPVTNVSVVLPVITQINTGVNVEQIFDNDVAALIGSIAAVTQ
jgi:hypothetical protein